MSVLSSLEKPDLSQTEGPPEWLICEMSGSVMTEPSHPSSCNHIYDKYSLDSWLSRNNICPYCRQKISSLVKDERLASKIQEYVDNHPQFFENKNFATLREEARQENKTIGPAFIPILTQVRDLIHQDGIEAAELITNEAFPEDCRQRDRLLKILTISYFEKNDLTNALRLYSSIKSYIEKSALILLLISKSDKLFGFFIDVLFRNFSDISNSEKHLNFLLHSVKPKINEENVESFITQVKKYLQIFSNTSKKMSVSQESSPANSLLKKLSWIKRLTIKLALFFYSIFHGDVSNSHFFEKVLTGKFNWEGSIDSLIKFLAEEIVQAPQEENLLYHLQEQLIRRDDSCSDISRAHKLYKLSKEHKKLGNLEKSNELKTTWSTEFSNMQKISFSMHCIINTLCKLVTFTIKALVLITKPCYNKIRQ
jgi:hypothetical protein